MDAVLCDRLVVKTRQDRAELIFMYKKVRHINAFVVHGNHPDNPGNNKEELVTHPAAPEKIIAFLEMPGLKSRQDRPPFPFGQRPQ